MAGPTAVEYTTDQFLTNGEPDLGKLRTAIREGAEQFLKDHQDEIAVLESSDEEGWGKLMKQFFSYVGTPLSIAGTVFPAFGSCAASFFTTGALWNFWDTAGGMTEGVEESRDAIKSKMSEFRHRAYGYANIGAGVGMIGATTWSIAEMGIHHTGMNFFNVSHASSAASTSLGYSSFSFAVAMIIGAASAFHNAAIAKRKSNPLNLLEDRLDKLKQVEEDQNTLIRLHVKLFPEMPMGNEFKYDKKTRNDAKPYSEKAKKEFKQNWSKYERLAKKYGNMHDMEQTRLRLMNQAGSIAHYLNNHNQMATTEKERCKLDKLNTDVKRLVDDTLNASDPKLVKHLIHKQKQKRKKSLINGIAFTFAAIGATILGIGSLFGSPVADSFAGVGAYSFATVIKLHQLKTRFHKRHAVLDQMRREYLVNAGNATKHEFQTEDIKIQDKRRTLEKLTSEKSKLSLFTKAYWTKRKEVNKAKHELHEAVGKLDTKVARRFIAEKMGYQESELDIKLTQNDMIGMIDEFADKHYSDLIDPIIGGVKSGKKALINQDLVFLEPEQTKKAQSVTTMWDVESQSINSSRPPSPYQPT